MHNVENYDLIIVGGGSIGLSAAYHASQRELRTLIVEKFGFFNDDGSSAGASRQFRLQYSQKYMSELVLASRAYWDELQKHSPEPLVNTVGSLWFGDPALSSQEGGIQAAMDTMDALEIPYSPLDSQQIETQYHFKDLPDNYTGFFQPDGGIINLKATQKAMYKLAADSGYVDFHEYESVTDIESREDGVVVVSTNKGVYSASKLAITPGPYVNQVLKHLGLWINLDIWEMSSAYYKKTDDEINYPTWFVFQKPQDTSLFYGFPEVDWAHPGYIRVAPDIPDCVLTDPSQRAQVPSSKSLDFNTEWVKQHMKGLAPDPEFTATCLIALSNNSKELLLDYAPEWVPNHKNIVVYTAGWAGKFIPILGEMLLRMLEEDSDTFHFDQYNIDRSHFEIQWQKARGEIGSYFKRGLQDGLELDVAIVGAGASGLYSGYRLKTGADKNGQTPDLNVQIFEMSNRIGGRLESIQLPGMDVVGEIGGMRYMTSQQIITALIEDVFTAQFGLQAVDFPMGSPYHHLYYLRGQRFFASAFEQARVTGEKFKTRYFVQAEYEGKSSDTIFNEIVSNVLNADGYNLEKIQNSKDPRRKWNKIKKKLRYRFDGPYKDMYVYEMGFWNLIKDQTSQECYEFLAQAGGYYSNTINWNAAEAFPYMVGDFADATVQYKTIQGGFDQVLVCLASAFMQAGGDIWVCNRLVTFDKNPDTTSPYKYVLTFFNEEHEKEWQVYARDVILSMPRRSLELLDQSNFFFDREQHRKLQHHLASVIIEPSFKILLGFENPWWETTLGARAGESITDLPMRQCYYFGVDPENSHSLFLASYNDMRTVPFWHALEQGKAFEPRLTRLTQQEDFIDPPFSYATHAMVHEVMKQVRELHGADIEIPEPYVSAYKDWGEDPFGGGYHAWNAHYKVWKTMPYMRQPLKDESIYIVGEAYSDQQGWVEGALCVAEHVMREAYDLVCPDWLDKNYYLGW